MKQQKIENNYLQELLGIFIYCGFELITLFLATGVSVANIGMFSTLHISSYILFCNTPT